MQATGLGGAGYLELFRQRSMELLARGEPAGYDKRVTTTWALALNQIQQAAPQAAGLLRLLACCAPESIPLGLLLRPGPGLAATFGPDVAPLVGPLLDDPIAVGDSVAALRRYSLISAPQDGTVSVHRLVQAVTLAQLSAEVAMAWRQAAGALIEAALPDHNREPANWPAYAALLPHALVALTAHSMGMARVAGYLGHIGNYTAALALQQQVLEARERALGTEDPATLTALADLAFWIAVVGDSAAARDQLTALLPVIVRVLGAEDPGTLTVRVNLAYLTGEAGDAAGARDQLAALLPVRERVLGSEHSECLGVRANIARRAGEAGDAAGARDQLAARPPAATSPTGPARRGAAGARDLLAALLPVRERVSGPEHPGTLTARANLAYWIAAARMRPGR